MEKSGNISCVLCENHCPLNNLGCKRGINFYEDKNGPICYFCENHCSLDRLGCKRGQAFFNDTSFQESERQNRALSENSNTEHYIKSLAAHNKNESESALPQLMKRCSHFVYFRGGRSSGQARVLRILASRPEGIQQNDLRSTMDLASSSMSEIVAKLEKKGLITCTADNMDKRKKLLCITDAGRKTFQTLKKDDIVEEVFHALNNDEQRALKFLLNKLIARWETSYISTKD